MTPQSLTKPQVLLLGTFHMGPTNDMVSMKMNDVFSANRQNEIAAVVELVKRFQPTKVALEIETKRDEAVNQHYRNYIAGKYELAINEADQIGFRIAAAFGHPKVFCIDWMEQGAGTKGAGEVYQWAKENQPELFNSIFGWLHNSNPTNSNRNGESAAAYKTIVDMYRDCNDPAKNNRLHSMNINIARIGEIDNYVGMEWLIWWYQRNLILFSNIVRLAASTDDRILLLIGSSHIPIIKQFLDDSGVVDVVMGAEYLQ